MATKSTTHAHIIETGETDYAVAISVSGHTLKGDEPSGAGGKNIGPAPYDYLTAALGECTAMTVRWYALQQKWPLEKVEVNVSHRREGRQDIFEKSVIITGPALTDDQREKLMEVSAKCPVQRTLENTPTITTKI